MESGDDIDKELNYETIYKCAAKCIVLHADNGTKYSGEYLHL